MRNKIAIITRENIVANVTLNRIIPGIIALGYQPVLFISGDPKIKALRAPSLRLASYYETELYRAVVKPFLNSHPILAAGVSFKDKNFTFEQLATTYKLSMTYVEDVNSDDFVKLIEQRDDIIGGINVRGLRIFKEPVINAFREKENGFFWNLHPGILPEYKGLFIPFHAAFNNEERVGQTLHNINTGIDQGAILGISTLPFDSQKPVFETYMDLTKPGADLVLDQLKLYKKNGAPQGQRQTPKEKESYYNIPTEEEMHALENAGTIMAVPEDVANIYTRYYSKRGSKHAQKLEAVINEALYLRSSKPSRISVAV